MTSTSPRTPPEVGGLLALMLLVDSRAPARVRDDALVALDEQDRTLWDAALIGEGHRLVRGCLAINPGPVVALNRAVAVAEVDGNEAEQRFLRTRRDRLKH